MKEFKETYNIKKNSLVIMDSIDEFSWYNYKKQMEDPKIKNVYLVDQYHLIYWISMIEDLGFKEIHTDFLINKSNGYEINAIRLSR